MLKSKNLLMAAAIGLPIEQIKNFVSSFRKVNHHDTFIVLVDQNTRNNSYEQFADNGVETIVCDASRYWTSPINSRHYFYYDIIKGISEEYKNVLITDTRDLIFQSDPFKHCPDADHLFAFEEDSNCGIGHEGHNRAWIRNIYGQQRVDELSNKPILNGGALMGSKKSLTEMLRLLTEETSKVDPQIASWSILDQPIINHICYSDLSRDLPLSIKKNGEVMGNVGLSLVHKWASDKITLDLKTNLVSVNGMIPSILHQWDRNPVLSYLFDKTYSLDPSKM